MELTLDKIWNFTLFVVDNHPVTTGSAIAAILAGLIVNIIAKYVRLRINGYLSRKTHVAPDLIVFIDKIVFFCNLLIVAIIVLKILHIPITELTVLGSAVAIGIGFAAKELLSNVISGFVIMLERLVKEGNVVQIEDEIGWIKSIGIRSTVIHTEENVDIILPNSKILESKIINWTLKDNNIFTYVEVGVAYNTDIHHATDIMLQAVNKFDFVFSDPEPFVLFSDFGDSALILHVYFTIQIRNKLQRWEKESKVRYQLFDDFKKAGIVIAFPQRDTHLDTSKPLDLRIIK